MHKEEKCESGGKGKFYLGGGFGRGTSVGRGRQNGEGIPFCCSALRKSRKSNASESMCIQPDGPGCNSPVQRAKHTPFFAIREWQKILVDRQRHKTF